MNPETYEALKRVVKNSNEFRPQNNQDIQRVEDWIDEVAKDYEETDKGKMKYRVNGNWLTLKEWKEQMANELADCLEYQEFDDYGTDKNGQEYFLRIIGTYKIEKG